MAGLAVGCWATCRYMQTPWDCCEWLQPLTASQTAACCYALQGAAGTLAREHCFSTWPDRGLLIRSAG